MSMSRPLLSSLHRPYLSLSIALAASTTFVLSRMSTSRPPSCATKTYTPRHSTWPYKPSDFHRQDSSPDTIFYQPARLVTHIDDAAIASLQSYYATALPRSGSILDFCSSWTSHLPPSIAQAVSNGELHVTGTGMNKAELDANPLLEKRVVHDLNSEPAGIPDGRYDAATCVVSIDYLTSPVEVLRSLKGKMVPGGMVHLVVSNRCFPTKAIARWLRVSEEERLLMVGDYLHFAGWEGIEILDLKAKDAGKEEVGALKGFMRGLGMGEDPLWVVRGRVGVRND